MAPEPIIGTLGETPGLFTLRHALTGGNGDLMRLETESNGAVCLSVEQGSRKT